MHGNAVKIGLDGSEVATAIDVYLNASGFYVYGPRTVTVNESLCRAGRVFVDPSGFVIHEGERYGSGESVDDLRTQIANLFAMLEEQWSEIRRLKAEKGPFR